MKMLIKLYQFFLIILPFKSKKIKDYLRVNVCHNGGHNVYIIGDEGYLKCNRCEVNILDNYDEFILEREDTYADSKIH